MQYIIKKQVKTREIILTVEHNIISNDDSNI